ncbi:leucyl/phenylalanyl-tRNA--protein transferase [Alteromonas sediminis]|uniref:Leucyl/phenylalanyl-tRNA--protein transferase n=1 Tax=Alteromonas sediminis TaxID=2259342 RepID=A0A3N5YAT5_9ALTE|nr:leucyl/phenylalanyl-tRNA--protein transferase [Alteromonas sediminis]RPJ68739.1 leucyl/phenylalanyl-tRNA--protein transferase [Alteromonas sediminis]
MSKIVLPYLEGNAPFPAPETALDEPNGLLCFGADLSPKRLKEAYSKGIFPWFSEGEPLLWWSPDPRAIIVPTEFHVSKSLKKHMRKAALSITLNTRFDEVIAACSSIPRYDHEGYQQGTWITHTMRDAYCRLHRLGYAHSIEVLRGETLVGGLYGVVTHGVFCGESMFHTETNASKVAMAALVALLTPYPHVFIDCQLPTDHLTSLGAKTVSRTQFLTMLKEANQHGLPKALWQKRALPTGC